MDTKGEAVGSRARGRRRWPAGLKRQIVLETLAPGASVSVVARRHDVNANQVFAWRRQHQDGALDVASGSSLVAVRVDGARPDPQAAAPGVESRPGIIEIELQGGRRVRVHGTVEAAALRQVLAALRGG